MMEPRSPNKDLANGSNQQSQQNSQQSSSSRIGLPSLKASLAPAEVTLTQHSHDKNINETRSPRSPQAIKDSIPRDYFHPNHESMDLKSISDSRIAENEHYKYHTQKEGHSKLAEALQRSADSQPGTPTSSFSANTSPFSSSESLASLIERQQRSKINHPNHQFYNATKRLSGSRKRSNASIFSVLGGHSNSHSISSTTSQTHSGNTPLVRSPLSEKRNPFNNLLSTTDSSSSSRKLEPTSSNPHFIHSSPEVKESNHVSLEYDPVSKRKVLNSYEIIREIGKGEHGKVKLAKDLVKDELVAIKIVDRKGRQKLGPSHLSGQSAEDKVRKEIAIMKKCRHPNVVQLKEVLDDANSKKIYLVLEYLENGEIKWKGTPDGPLLTMQQAISALRDVVLGLEYLHYQGIIHRDIKPANLLLSSEYSVKISDFGVSFASSLNGDDQNELDLCKSAGTPAFFAPELCEPLTNFDETKERPKITHKIDVWALGITFYCLLFGELPFWGGNEFELFNSINNDELKFPETFPSNYEWTEEEIFQAKNLLGKMLDKDPTKRIGLKGIKRHPFVLNGLSVEEARLFTGDQKSCESKIHVSNEEVKVAVTGIAGKLRKGFAKALKFAGLGGTRRTSQNSTLLRTTSNAETVRPSTLGSQSRSLSFQSHEAAAKSLNIVDLESTRKKSYAASPLQNDTTLQPTTSASSSSKRHHRRVKSGELSGGTATRATVQGDLFLNRSTAFNALSGIMDDDKRRASVVSMGGRSSTSETQQGTSNGSSLDNGTQFVSLPVNASFGSLDSDDLDDYVNAQRLTLSSEEAGEDDVQEKQEKQEESSTEVKKPSPRDLFTRMNSYSLNMATEKKHDEAVGPHEPSDNSFSMSVDNDDYNEAEADDELGQISPGPERMDSTSSAKRLNSVATNVSQYSVPSILAGQLKSSESHIYEDVPKPEIVISEESKPESPLKRPPLIQRGSTPQYSFFGNDSSSDSDSSSSNSPNRARPLRSFPQRSVPPAIQEPITISHDSESESESEDEDSDDDNDELTLVLGSRRSSRINSVTVASLNRPNSEPRNMSTASDLNDGDLLQLPTSAQISRSNSRSVRRSAGNTERACSPLAKNAPKTPLASANAHLQKLQQSPETKDEYINHYNKKHIMEPITKTHFFGGISSLDEVMDQRQRSNSVTVGLLNQNRARQQSSSEI